MTNHPVSTNVLVKSTIAASVIALVVFVCFILPAEYNIDPTHIGEKLGLTDLAQDVAPAVGIELHEQNQHVIELTIPAGKGIEYKFQMNQYDKMTYEWITDSQPLYFDLHGEPEGDTTDYFESYAIATLPEMKGSFTSPFAGSHGWYWKNTSDNPVAVQLIVKGQFTVIGLK